MRRFMVDWLSVCVRGGVEGRKGFRFGHAKWVAVVPLGWFLVLVLLVVLRKREKGKGEEKVREVRLLAFALSPERERDGER